MLRSSARQNGYVIIKKSKATSLKSKCIHISCLVAVQSYKNSIKSKHFGILELPDSEVVEFLKHCVVYK